ncbi:MAG: HPr(Ser) kinase/phosphatase, partial [Acidobacteriota bacterium]
MSQPAAIPVQRLLDEAQLAPLSLQVAAGERGLSERRISSPRIQKPGLALAGYLPYVRPDRIQILGESEYAYLGTFSEEEAVSRFLKLVELEVPCVLSTKDNRPPQAVLDAGDSAGIPFLASPAQTSEVIETISTFLEDELAPRTQVHGVLLDVFSLGTLIIGDPGIGKSECALELVYRGHHLVADDTVVIRRTHHRGLLGSPHELLQNYLELRGVGIIDVRKHFGMTSISPAVTISLVIQLTKLTPKAKEMEQRWREQMMERPSAWMTTENILGTEVPKYTMVVAPGRDVAIMVETAVRKCLLAQRGIEDERGFLENVNLIARGDLHEGD